MTKKHFVLLVLMWSMIAVVLSSLVALVPLAGPVKADLMELAYDDGTPAGLVSHPCSSCDDYQGVFFSLPAGVQSASVTEVRFYFNPGSTGTSSVIIYLLGGFSYLSSPITYQASSIGWHKVAVPETTVTGDFRVVIGVGAGRVAYDRYNDNGRSWTGSNEKNMSEPFKTGDIMIRAVIRAELHVGPDQSYKTIQAAVDAAAPGVTVVVHDGTYVENIKVDKNITIQSKNGATRTTVQAANPDSDVFKVTADGVTISGFTVQGASGTGKAGIGLENAGKCIITNNSISDCDYGILALNSSSGIMSGNTVSGNNTGVGVAASTSVLIGDNTMSGNDVGIEVTESSSGNKIFNSKIYNNGNAIRIEGTNNEITGNEVDNNTGAAGSAIHLTGSASGNYAHFNRITANSSQTDGSLAVYNENSAEAADASLNWWGDASGPYHPSANPDGSGDVVGDYVSFEPWLGAAPVAVASGVATGDPPIIDARADESTAVIKTGSGTPIIWVASFSDNPTGIPLSTKDIGKWIDVYFNSTSDVQQVEIGLYYTPEQITGVHEGSLRLYWWDSLNSKWQVCSSSGVDTANNYIWAKITPGSNPGLDSLTGTLFAGGTTSASFHWWLIPVVLIVLIVLAVAARLAYAIVIKGVRPADTE